MPCLLFSALLSVVPTQATSGFVYTQPGQHVGRNFFIAVNNVSTATKPSLLATCASITVCRGYRDGINVIDARLQISLTFTRPRSGKFDADIFHAGTFRKRCSADCCKQIIRLHFFSALQFHGNTVVIHVYFAIPSPVIILIFSAFELFLRAVLQHLRPLWEESAAAFPLPSLPFPFLRGNCPISHPITPPPTKSKFRVLRHVENFITRNNTFAVIFEHTRANRNRNRCENNVIGRHGFFRTVFLRHFDRVFYRSVCRSR